MLARVAERIRNATTLHAIAHVVMAELAGGVGGAALVLCDPRGDPDLWIGDAGVDRAAVQAYLRGGHHADACFARVRQTHAPQRDGALWVAPLLGAEGVVGMLRVRGGELDPVALTAIAAYVSIRIAVLGLDDTRAIDTLTPRQREVAELVAHGCTNAEIAHMLAISPHAVKKHVSRVLAALDVSNRTELAALTGRWRGASGTGQDLPPTLQVVLRNPAKPAAVACDDEVA